MLLLLSIILRILSVTLDNATDIFEAFLIILSINSVFTCVLILQFLSEFKPLGVLVIIASKMVTDVANFLLLLMAVTFGFSIALIGQQTLGRFRADEQQSDDFFSVTGAFTEPIWSLFGNFNEYSYDWLTSGVMIMCAA